ncbi:Putative cytoplasmic protein [Salmonella bongori]|nr:Putative cytoplasmic protein [Salmonella bongori]
MAIKPFNYQQDFSSIDFRQHPELYQVGRGEQGVLLVEPYKSEILPFWRYKDEASAVTSAEQIYQLFETYRQQDDFVGMDMARKFIQMGYTRARRYANYKGGKKYAEDGSLNTRGNDPTKAAAATVFKGWWDKIRQDEDYLKRKNASIRHVGVKNYQTNN